jgi:hypothetical protein
MVMKYGILRNLSDLTLSNCIDLYKYLDKIDFKFPEIFKNYPNFDHLTLVKLDKIEKPLGLLFHNYDVNDGYNTIENNNIPELLEFLKQDDCPVVKVQNLYSEATSSYFIPIDLSKYDIHFKRITEDDWNILDSNTIKYPRHRPSCILRGKAPGKRNTPDSILKYLRKNYEKNNMQYFYEKNNIKYLNKSGFAEYKKYLNKYGFDEYEQPFENFPRQIKK